MCKSSMPSALNKPFDGPRAEVKVLDDLRHAAASTNAAGDQSPKGAPPPRGAHAMQPNKYKMMRTAARGQLFDEARGGW